MSDSFTADVTESADAPPAVDADEPRRQASSIEMQGLHKRFVGLDSTLFETANDLYATPVKRVVHYDIIVPSNDYVPRLIQTGRVQKLDKSKLDNVMEQFQDPAFDPGAVYSTPYQ